MKKLVRFSNSLMRRMESAVITFLQMFEQTFPPLSDALLVVPAKPAAWKAGIAGFVLMLSGLAVNAQITVFSDDFSANTNTAYTTSGAIGASAWNISRSGADWGGRRNTSPAQLELTNDVSGTTNVNGWVLASTASSSFPLPYKTTLNTNPGPVTWTFNMQQIRTDPAGFGLGSYGVAFILAGQSTTSATAGNGYAVVLGQSGSVDSIRLVSYTSGLQGTLTNLIKSNTAGLTDFGADYLSVKVTYTPSTNTWELFLRNDGASAFADPAAGIMTSQGTTVNSTYTGTVLGLMGAYWQGSTGAAQPAFFDNAKVTVTCSTPPTCSISGPGLYVCNNTAGVTYSAPAGMSAYNWSISGAGGSIPGSTSGQSVSVTTGNLSQDYTVFVTITDANGCTSSCSEQSYVVFSKPPADITISPIPACFGAALDLSILSQSSSTVTWAGEGIVSTGGTFIPSNDFFIPYNNVTTAIPTTTGPHIYTVTVTSSFYYGGCSNTGTASVNVLPAPPACSITGPTSVCANSTGNVYFAPGGVSAYSWGVSGGTIVGATTGSYVSVTAGASGTYTVSVTLTDGNGCTSTCSQPVTINPLPSGVITGPAPFPGPNNDTLCTTLQYMFTGPPGMSAHKWGVSANGTIDGSATGSSVLITVNSGSSLTVRDTITDANGCTSVLIYNRNVQQSPTCTINGPLTVCGGSAGNVYTVTSNAGTSGYYVWSISGDGVIPSSPTSGYNVTSVTVTAGASGTYTVTVDLKFDFSTCLRSCSETVTINGAAVPTITGPTSVCSGGSVMLDAGAGYSTYSWSGGGGSGQTATYSNITSPTTYTVTVTNGICTGTDTHTVTPQSCLVDFSGKIIFSNNNTLGVNNALVSLTGSAAGSDLSDTIGNYFIATAVTSGSFTLKPTKTGNKLNGVTAADATAVQQHATLINPITDMYKLVAADVNKTNSVNTLDASLITQSLLGNPAALAQFNTSWRFVPTSHVMTNPPWGFPEQRNYVAISGAQANQDFYGIKTGDVTTAYANPANFGTGEPLVLTTPDQVLKAGESIEVAFSAGQLNDLAAFQFGLVFDPAQLQFEAAEPLAGGLPLTADHFGTYQAAEGELRAVWAQAAGIRVEEATPAFRLRFKALQSGAALSTALRLDDTVLPALSYTTALAESPVQLTFTESTGTGAVTAANGVQLFQNRPNPFKGATAIGFVLPEACTAQLRVFDASGRMLAERKAEYPAGKQEVLFELNTAAGVLYYELTTPFGVLSRKMVAAEK